VADDSARYALMSWYFEEQITSFKPYLEDPAGPRGGFQMIGTSGTVTTVGAAHLGLKRYDRRKVDGMHLSSRAIDQVIGRFLRLGPEGRRSDIGLGRDRSELIMSGAAILQTLLRIWPTESMRVADRGLREGMLFSMMSAKGAFAGGVRPE
jgi:exopolyphosphatase/guanosine-5'-triphosphate,3'-diphosphate pyrophosphatase